MSQSAQNADREFRDDLMRNVSRLLADAVLLKRHERFASAFALGVLALEEVGKLILDVWFPTDAHPSNRTSKHIQKQRAVAALLLARTAVTEVSTMAVNIMAPSEGDIERLAKALLGSKECRFSRIVDLTALERTKQLAMYLDRLPISSDLRAENFVATDVDDLFMRVRAAVSELGDEKAMRVALALYLCREDRAASRRKGKLDVNAV